MSGCSRPGQQAASIPALVSSAAEAVSWSPEANGYLELLRSFAPVVYAALPDSVALGLSAEALTRRMLDYYRFFVREFPPPTQVYRGLPGIHVVVRNPAEADEQRVAQEIAILADRLDVAEELDRFRSHMTAFREALHAEGGEPVGKRLGFLLQEMLREANTTGSKGNDAAILREVVLVKEELERIREQVENLE